MVTQALGILTVQSQPLAGWTRGWFEAHPDLPPNNLHVSSLSELRGRANLEQVLRTILDSPFRSFVIVAHGETRGLSMPLAPGCAVSALDQSLERLMLIAEGSTAPTIRSPMHVAPTDLPVLGLTQEPQILALVELMNRVRAKHIEQLEFRSCIIGRFPEVAHTFRRFFGAGRLGAPMLFNSFGEGTISTGRSPDAALRRAPWMARTYGSPPNSVTWFVHTAHHEGNLLWTTDSIAGFADNVAAADSWTRQFLASNASYTGRAIPIHYMFGSPPMGDGAQTDLDSDSPDWAWPMENAYKDRIRYVFG